MKKIMDNRTTFCVMNVYGTLTVANSCSTMHKIHAKEFTVDDFSCEHLEDIWLESLKRTIGDLNCARNGYLQALKDSEPLIAPKDYWYQMIQLLPSSYNQKRTLMLNYAVLRNIYFARKDHKLDEWHDFCKWIEKLPFSELITLEK